MDQPPLKEIAHIDLTADRSERCDHNPAKWTFLQVDRLKKSRGVNPVCCLKARVSAEGAL